MTGTKARGLLFAQSDKMCICTSCRYHGLVCCPGLTLSLAPPPPSKKDRPPVMPKTQSKHDLTITDHQTDSTAGDNGVCSGQGQSVVGGVKV